MQAPSAARAEDLIVSAMWRHSGKPKAYRYPDSVLRGERIAYHAFFKPPVANVIGFVNQAVGKRFQVQKLGLARLEKPPIFDETDDVSLWTGLDEINRTYFLPCFAARNLGSHPANHGTSAADVQGQWYVQLNFAGHPGPENFFNAVRAVQQAIV